MIKTNLMWFALFISLTGLAFAKIKIEEKYLLVNGDSIYCKIMGSGEPLVIIHGGPGLDHTYLLPQFEELAKYYKLIFYDQRGSGNSSGFVDSSSITINNFVEDIEDLRKSLGLKKINILGHSWGSLLATYYILKYPAEVNKVILVSIVGSTSNIKRSKKESSNLVRLIYSADSVKGNIQAVENLVKSFFRSYFYDQTKENELSIHFTQNTANNFSSVFILLSKELAHFDLRERLKKINNKVLIIHGDHDPVPIESAEELHHLIKNSELVVLKNCGHFPFIESREQFFKECEKFIN